MADDDGRPMHSMMALYWKAEETEKSQEEDHRSTKSNESFQTKQISLTKVVKINEKDELIFVKYNSYIMLPWFTLSSILNEPDEEKLKNLVKFSFKFVFQTFVFKANKSGFKPMMIDPLSYPLLCSELSKLTSASTQISLYSIDCVRKILQSFHYQQSIVFDLLDRARLAEASDDMSFWDETFEVRRRIY